MNDVFNERTQGSSQNDPVEVFSGTAWEVALVQSLLENAEIKVYVYYGGNGTLSPLNSVGGLPLNRITISTEDVEKAKQVIDQYRQAMKE
jgi:hypothetical protein